MHKFATEGAKGKLSNLHQHLENRTQDQSTFFHHPSDDTHVNYMKVMRPVIFVYCVLCREYPIPNPEFHAIHS